MNIFAQDIQSINSLNRQQQLLLLQNILKNSEFSQLGYADNNGLALISNGLTFNIADRDYFKLSIIGKHTITDLDNNRFNIPGKVVVFAVPVYSKEGNYIQGILLGVYDIEKLLDTISLNFFDKNIHIHVLKKDLYASYELLHKELFSVPDSIVTEKLFANSSFQNYLHSTSSKEAIFEIFANRERNFVAISPVNSKKVTNLNWYTFAIFPKSTVFKHANAAISQIVFLIIIFSVAFTIFFFYVLKVKKYNKLKLEKLAYQDELTKLNNYNGFLANGNYLVENSLYKIVVIYFDINNFKLINGIFSYDYGNDLLKIIAQTLKDTFKQDTVLARLSMDHFAVISRYANKEQIFDILEHFLSLINHKYTGKYSIKLSIGVYFNPSNHKPNILNMLNKANLARKYVKNQEYLPYAMFDKDIEQNLIERTWLVDELKLAIEAQSFEVYYQPKFDLKNGKAVSTEALIRWNHPQKGFINPAVFIPLSEERQITPAITKIVLTKVCKNILELRQENLPVLTCAVNFSQIDFYSPNLSQNISEILKAYNIVPELLEIEITETAIFSDYQYMESILKELKKLGLSIAIDDFGSGYSSIANLSALTVDIIKIDRSILVNAFKDDKSMSILKSIIKLAQDIQLQIVCEGVETEAQLELLKTLNCDYAQGYIYSKPLSFSEYKLFLQQIYA